VRGRLVVVALLASLLVAPAPRRLAIDAPAAPVRPLVSVPAPVELGAAAAVLEKGLHPRWRPTALRVALERVLEP
jgi:hypothetical protein